MFKDLEGFLKFRHLTDRYAEIVLFQSRRRHRTTLRGFNKLNYGK